MKKIKAVIFDLYGTLIYRPNKSTVYAKLSRNLNLTKDARRIALTERFDKISDFIRRVDPEGKIDIEKYEEKVRKDIDSINIYPETRNVLESIKEKNLSLGLISNLSTPYIEPFFRFNLNEMIAHPLFSCEAGFTKPDKRIYQKMLEILEVNANEALMVGNDIHCDVIGPKESGINAVLLDRENRLGCMKKIETLEGILDYL